MAASHGMIEPFEAGQVRQALRRAEDHLYGTSSYGYDVRCANEFKIFTSINSTIVDPKHFDEKSFVDVKADVCLIPPNSFALLRAPRNISVFWRSVLTICLGKSTYARCGVIVNVTPLEPEWEGHVTLEFSNTTPLPARIYANEGVAQMLFFESDEVCSTSYRGSRRQVSWGKKGGDAAEDLVGCLRRRVAHGGDAHRQVDTAVAAACVACSGRYSSFGASQRAGVTVVGARAVAAVDDHGFEFAQRGVQNLACARLRIEIFLRLVLVEQLELRGSEAGLVVAASVRSAPTSDPGCRHRAVDPRYASRRCRAPARSWRRKSDRHHPDGRGPGPLPGSAAGTIWPSASVEGAALNQCAPERLQAENAMRLDVRKLVGEGAGSQGWGRERQGGIPGRNAMPGHLVGGDKGRWRGLRRHGRGQHPGDCTIAP